MTDIRTPVDADTNPSQINLDKLAGDHDWSMEQLTKLVVHLEEYAYNETSEFDEKYTLIALIGAVKSGVEKATREAEQLNVTNAMPGYTLMALKDQRHVGGASQWDRLRYLLNQATDPAATREDLAKCLNGARGLAKADGDFCQELTILERIVEQRGYSVGWLSTLSGETAHLVVIGAREGRDISASQAPDLRACLTADEIYRGSRLLTDLLVRTLTTGYPFGGENRHAAAVHSDQVDSAMPIDGQGSMAPTA